MYEQRMREIDNRISELMAARDQEKANEAAADRDYNKALADSKREREIQQKLEETFQNMSEMKEVSSSNLLTENPLQATGTNGKMVTYAFKGMSPDKIAEIQQKQAEQLEEMKVCILLLLPYLRCLE